MYDVAAQLVGFCGTGMFLVSFQCKATGKLIFFQLLGYTLFAVHYFMMGAYTGCISQALSIFSNVLLCCQKKKWARLQGWRWLFSGLFILAMVFTWQGAVSLLPCAAAVTTTLVSWTRNGKVIRLGRLFVVGPSWLIYNVFNRSYSGILCELLGIGSILISLCRYGLKTLDQVE